MPNTWIFMDWMWYEFHEGGETHVITYHAYAQCKQSYCGVWGHHCWHEQYSVVTSLWLPTTVLGAKPFLIYIIWKYRPLYSDPSPQPCHSGLICVPNCDTNIKCVTISFFMLKLCLATTIWPLTKYKVCQTPLICMDWMWYEFHEGGECWCPQGRDQLGQKLF